uniref:Uncharacterized protein n=1 Tax=Arundo donax TaxID=35708 RepID=A0A0A9B6W3_ARUDO
MVGSFAQLHRYIHTLYAHVTIPFLLKVSKTVIPQTTVSVKSDK